MVQTQSGVPMFTPKEMSDLLAYLYFLHFIDAPGDATNGKRLFSEMGCSQCHGLDGGRGKLMYINLSKYGNQAQTEIVASIWNHSMHIRKAMGEEGLTWPSSKRGRWRTFSNSSELPGGNRILTGPIGVPWPLSG